MAEEIVTGVTIRIGSYSDHPLPEALEEGWVYRAFVDGPVDREELVKQIKESLQPNPFTLDDKVSRTSWGADASVLEIVAQVAQFMGGAAGLVALVDRMIERLQNKDVPQGEVTSEMAASNVRRHLAEFLQRNEQDISIEGLERVTEGFRLRLRVGSDLFEAEVDDREVYHWRKISNSKRKSLLRRLRDRGRH